MENLEDKLKTFNKNLSIFKDSDIEIFQTHLSQFKQENLRLENENKKSQKLVNIFINNIEHFHSG